MKFVPLNASPTGSTVATTKSVELFQVGNGDVGACERQPPDAASRTEVCGPWSGWREVGRDTAAGTLRGSPVLRLRDRGEGQDLNSPKVGRRDGPAPDARLKAGRRWSHFTSRRPIFLRAGLRLRGLCRALRATGWARSLGLSDSKLQACSRLLSKLLPENWTPTSYSSDWVVNLSTQVDVLGGWKVGVGNSQTVMRMVSENSPEPGRQQRGVPGPGKAGPLAPQSRGMNQDSGGTDGLEGPRLASPAQQPHANPSGGGISVCVTHTE